MLRISCSSVLPTTLALLLSITLHISIAPLAIAEAKNAPLNPGIHIVNYKQIPLKKENKNNYLRIPEQTPTPNPCPNPLVFCQDAAGEYEYKCCNPETEDCDASDPIVGPVCVVKNCSPDHFKCESSGDSRYFECCSTSEICEHNSEGSAECLGCKEGEFACNKAGTPFAGVCCKAATEGCGTDGDGAAYCYQISSSSSSGTSQNTSRPSQ